MVSLTSAESRLRRARLISAVKSFGAITGHRFPHLGEGIPSSLLRFHDLVPGADQVAVWVVGQEPPGEIELHRYHGKGMAKEVVQIACDAFALRFLGETFDLRICALQKSIGSCLLGERKITEPKNHAEEKDVFSGGKRATEISSLRHDSGHHRNQHQEQGAQTSDEKAKHRERVNKHSVGFLVERVIEKGDGGRTTQTPLSAGVP